MKARIHWKRPEDGGRQSLPIGDSKKHPPGYLPRVEFPDGETLTPGIVWSLLIEKLDDTGEEYCWLAEVRYFYPDAPEAELRAGRAFKLYEGGRCVATGVLLGE